MRSGTSINYSPHTRAGLATRLCPCPATRSKSFRPDLPVHAGKRRADYTLSLFLRLGGLGGALWQQTIRTLERLSGFQHRALPELVDGGHLDGMDGDVGAAYVRTVRRGTPADAEWFGRLARSDRSKILPHLWLLADALGVLHGASVSHRGLWPGPLFVEQKAGDHPDEDAPPEIESVHLARFEMSALLANLFRGRTGVATYDQLRQTYLAGGDRSLLYAAPERLDFVFDRPNGDLGGPAGDVFSLVGMPPERVACLASLLPVARVRFGHTRLRSVSLRRCAARQGVGQQAVGQFQIVVRQG